MYFMLFSPILRYLPPLTLLVFAVSAAKNLSHFFPNYLAFSLYSLTTPSCIP